MNKGYSYFRGWCFLSISLFLVLISACTYDYFEDETNYEVYVPKADKNLRTETYKIENLNIFIYNEEGLRKERYSSDPFSENARSVVGNFNFRLYPGSHYVYCFANIQRDAFLDINSYNQVGFGLERFDDGFYREPSAIYVERLEPHIHFPGPVISDTAWFEQKYVGRICVAFKNLTQLNPLLTDANIEKIETEASGIGTIQYLSKLTNRNDTRSSRNGVNDRMRLTAELFDPEYKDFDFGIQNYYFPSPGLSADGVVEPIYLKLKFIGSGGNVLSQLEVAVTEKNGDPIILHMNETLVVEVNGNNVQVLRLDDPEQWNPQIVEEGDSGPGSGGLEI